MCAAADLITAAATCEYTGKSLQEKANTEPDAVYTVFQACFNGTDGQPEPCTTRASARWTAPPVTIYAVLRNGMYVGTACLTAGDSKVFTPPIAVVVARRFKDLDWPQSTLSVEPRDGRTLVNFETIFYTTNNQPTSKSVELAGAAGRDPGNPDRPTPGTSGTDRASPRPARASPTPIRTSCTPTSASIPSSRAWTPLYSGRFRVNGGEWEDIDETVTVAGESVDLEILEATPELVTDPNE